MMQLLMEVVPWLPWAGVTALLLPFVLTWLCRHRIMVRAIRRPDGLDFLVQNAEDVEIPWPMQVRLVVVGGGGKFASVPTISCGTRKTADYNGIVLPHDGLRDEGRTAVLYVASMRAMETWSIACDVAASQEVALFIEGWDAREKRETSFEPVLPREIVSSSRRRGAGKSAGFSPPVVALAGILVAAIFAYVAFVYYAIPWLSKVAWLKSLFLPESADPMTADWVMIGLMCFLITFVFCLIRRRPAALVQGYRDRKVVTDSFGVG